MTKPLKDQLDQLYAIAQNAGLNEAVKFIQTFIQKQQAIEVKHETKLRKVQ